MSAQLALLPTALAQARYERLPAAQRIVSLSPAFAAADALRDPTLRCEHALWEDPAAGSAWLHSVHLRPLGAVASGVEGQGALSPYGYGGPLTEGEGPWDAAWSAWQGWCRSQGVLAEFCRFHPQAQGHPAFGGTVQENRATVSIDLTLDDPEAGFNSLTRRKVARARKAGVASRWSQDPADWARYAGFYREAMQAIAATDFYFFPDAYFEALRQVPGARLLVCELGGRWLSGGVYLLGPQVMEYHLGASSAQGKKLGTACLLQAEAATTGRAAGARDLYLGGGTDASPDNPLLFYKLGFSRRTLPFRVGEAIHDDNRYWAQAARRGHAPGHPPPRLLLD